jgi:parvulin-like peptidyl-prolyl isomerase
MRKRFGPLIPLLILIVMISLAAADVVEEIVAIVNDDIITLSQFKQYHDSLYQMLRSQFQGDELEKQYTKAKDELLNNMITDLLLLQLAKQKQLNVVEWVKSYIDNVKKENNIESDTQLKQALLEQGMNYEEFLKQIEDNAMRQAVIASEVERSIVIEEAEAVNYFKLHQEEFIEPEEYRLRAIYLTSEEKNQEELDEKKTQIEEKVKAGEDFVALVGEYADSPLKDSQGDLGFIKKGQLDKILEQAVVKLKVGEVTPWIQAKNGWYLLKLEEKKESRLPTYEEVKEGIGKRLFAEKRAKKLDDFLKEIRAKSYIKILKPNPLNFQ